MIGIRQVSDPYQNAPVPNQVAHHVFSSLNPARVTLFRLDEDTRTVIGYIPTSRILTSSVANGGHMVTIAATPAQVDKFTQKPPYISLVFKTTGIRM